MNRVQHCCNMFNLIIDIFFFLLEKLGIISTSMEEENCQLVISENIKHYSISVEEKKILKIIQYQ